MTLEERRKKIYNNGKNMAYNTLWDGLQDCGKRTNYAICFNYWDFWEEIKPKYIIVTDTLEMICCNSRHLTKLPEIQSALEDKSFKNIRYAFGGDQQLKSVDFDLVIKPDEGKDLNATGLFSYCLELEKVQKIHIIDNETPNQIWKEAFSWCKNLQEIIFEGAITSNISFAHSSKLSAASVNSIIEALSSERPATLVFHEDIIKNLNDTQKSSIRGKNWTLKDNNGNTILPSEAEAEASL